MSINKMECVHCDVIKITLQSDISQQNKTSAFTSIQIQKLHLDRNISFAAFNADWTVAKIRFNGVESQLVTVKSALTAASEKWEARYS